MGGQLLVGAQRPRHDQPPQTVLDLPVDGSGIPVVQYQHSLPASYRLSSTAAANSSNSSRTPAASSTIILIALLLIAAAAAVPPYTGIPAQISRRPAAAAKACRSYTPPPKCTIPSSTLTISATPGGYKEEGRKNPLRFFKGCKGGIKRRERLSAVFPAFSLFHSEALRPPAKRLSLLPGQTAFAPKVLLLLFFPKKRRETLVFCPYASSCSSSSTREPKRARASLTGWGVDISTPAIFSRDTGSVEQPPERNRK